jgi:hypothetical protein
MQPIECKIGSSNKSKWTHSPTATGARQVLHPRRPRSSPPLGRLGPRPSLHARTRPRRRRERHRSRPAHLPLRLRVRTPNEPPWREGVQYSKWRKREIVIGRLRCVVLITTVITLLNHHCNWAHCNFTRLKAVGSREWGKKRIIV